MCQDAQQLAPPPSEQCSRRRTGSPTLTPSASRPQSCEDEVACSRPPGQTRKTCTPQQRSGLLGMDPTTWSCCKTSLVEREKGGQVVTAGIAAVTRGREIRRRRELCGLPKPIWIAFGLRVGDSVAHGCMHLGHWTLPHYCTPSPLLLQVSIDSSLSSVDRPSGSAARAHLDGSLDGSAEYLVPSIVDRIPLSLHSNCPLQQVQDPASPHRLVRAAHVVFNCLPPGIPNVGA
ncbi:hypothetical protein HDK77DRAFT_102115 [Phyllosticta capitalensis]